jgi:hypothetical protein
MLRRKLPAVQIIAILYLLFGIFLFRAVPVSDEVHASMYSNWNTTDALLVKAYHIPGYLWFFPFACMFVILWFLGPKFSKFSKLINIASGLLLFLLVIHIIDWLNLFHFCHQWGCSGGLLPTWRLFQ